MDATPQESVQEQVLIVIDSEAEGATPFDAPIFGGSDGAIAQTLMLLAPLLAAWYVARAWRHLARGYEEASHD